MKRLWLIVLLAAAAGAVLVRWNWEALVDLARQRAERELSAALRSPARIRTLRVSLFPPQLWAEGVEVGAERTVLQMESLGARLAMLSSIAEGRPVFTADISGLHVDLVARPPVEEDDDTAFSVLPFRVGVLRISDLSLVFPFGDEVARLTVQRLRAHGQSALFRALVSANLRLQGCQLTRGSESLDLDSVRIVAHAGAEGPVIESASLRGPGRSVEITGEGPNLHHLRLALDVHDLSIIDDHFRHYRGSGTGTGTITGPLRALSIAGAIRIEDLHVAGRPLGLLTASVHHIGDTSRFEDALLRGDGGEIGGAVVVGYSGATPLEATIDWHVTSVGTVLNKLGVSLEVDQTLTARSVITGQLDPLALDVSAEGRLASGSATADLLVKGRVEEEAAVVDLTLSREERARIAGRIAIRNGLIDGRVDLETSDLAAMVQLAPRPVAALDLTGAGQAAVFLRGPVAEPRLEGEVVAGPLGVFGVQVDQLRGTFTWREAQLVVGSLELETSGGGTARASGSVGLTGAMTNEWELKVDRVDTDLLLGIANRFAAMPPATGGGTVSGAIECRGKWEAPSLRIDAAVDDLRVLGEPFSRIALDGEMRGPRWKLDVRATHSGNATVDITGSGTSIADAEVLIAARTIDLGRLAVTAQTDLAGRVDLEGQLRGNLRSPGGQITVVVSDLVVAGERVGSLELRGQGRAGVWVLEGQGAGQQMQVSAQMTTSPRFPYQVRLEWRDLAIDLHAAGAERLRSRMRGEVAARGELVAWDASEVSLHVSELDLTWRDVSIRAANPLQIRGRNRRFELSPITLLGRETDLTLAGSVDGGELTAMARGSVSLSYAELLGEPLESAAGRIELDVKARSPDLRHWQAQGTAVITGGVLDFGTLVAFTDVAGAIEFVGDEARIRQLEAKSGTGWLRLGGGIDLQRGPTLVWYAGSLPVNLQPALEAVIDGSGRLEARDWRDLTLSGAVKVQSALYSQDVEIVDIPALFAPRVKQVAEAAPRPLVIRLDLNAASSGGLYVDNNVAQVELSLDMDIKGTIYKPRLIGNVGIVGGQVRFRRRTFELTGGTADFRGRVPPNPSLNINAETAVHTRDADYLITATVTGTARDPVVQLAADDPTLSQTDIVALVTVGRTAAQAQGESGGVSRVDALALLPMAPVEERVSEIVGIDRFEIDLAQTNSQGNVSPGVTIGKSITERFRAALTTSFDAATRNVVGLEYDLTRRISLIGQWEAATESEAGAFGAGVRMRYEFRRLPLSLWGGSKPAASETDAE